MKWLAGHAVAFVGVMLSGFAAARADRVLDGGMHALRWGPDREWASFPVKAEGEKLELHFTAEPNPSEWTLRIRHRDLKQAWQAVLNDRIVAKLPADENEMVTCWAVPPGALRRGENHLVIRCTGGESDDVMVGEIRLLERSRSAVLCEGAMEIEVVEAGTGRPLPGRITITDERGVLIETGTGSNATHAVRPGVIYTMDGRAHVPLPAGAYRVYAGRGFEYSIAAASVRVEPGKSQLQRLEIRRVVPTPGLVSCDTHLHTLSFSRHGDATLQERMITLAGEGIELAVSAEHNQQVDYASARETAGAGEYFTTIMGNEVTTEKLGHFNVFPIPAGLRLINWRRRTWAALAEEFARVPGEPVIVLNHARDVHGGFRPFGPAEHLGSVGQTLQPSAVPANAMEVLNSGSTQTDPIQLYRDWAGMLNRGFKLTPIGASDSHDVSRYIVGQGRTYIRCEDADPGHIDVETARRSLRAGHVMVSFGLLAEITVQGQAGPGDLASAPGDVDVQVRVLGPEWTQARHVTLYANGLPIREADIAAAQGSQGGVKWVGRWTIPHPKQDVWLYALATGPDIAQPFWPIAKPYQPATPEWSGYVLGSTGAVWIDADGSGTFESAHDYASRLVVDGGDLSVRLDGYDAAIAAQAASLLHDRDPLRFERERQIILQSGPPAARQGFDMFLSDLKSHQSAQPPAAP